MTDTDEPKYKYNILLQIGHDRGNDPTSIGTFKSGYYTNDEFKPYIDIVSPDGKKWTFAYEDRWIDVKGEFFPKGTTQLTYRYKESS